MKNKASAYDAFCNVNFLLLNVRECKHIFKRCDMIGRGIVISTSGNGESRKIFKLTFKFTSSL